MLRMYRDDSYPLTLYIALGIPILMNAVHLVFSVLSSTEDVFSRGSIDHLWGMGFLTVLGAAAVYFGADFVNRGSRYDVDTFYPLVQASVLQGTATLICLVIRRFLPFGQAMR